MTADRSIRVLIVDDYKSMVRIIRSLMQQLGFTNIDEATDAKTALDMISTGDYGLVLSDWNMAPMNGIELLKAVRADPQRASTPFVMVTSHAAPSDIMTAKRAGASNYLIKPFNVEALRQKLSLVLGEL